MNAMQNVRRQMYGVQYPRWTPAPYRVPGAGPIRPSVHADRMEPLPAAHSNNDLDKRRRLSEVLEKLTVQINNNNKYPIPSWLVLEASQSASNDDEGPLDLSLKSERPQTPEQYACNDCGQTFAMHDRLTKHIASRHRNRNDSVRAYECDVCFRKFARSDMLTRHARLHSGIKPYACNSCWQVFSRSDHLATHQRTHTGEKPYKCPSCPYAACRRDMITRHLRTHGVRRA